MPTIRQMAEPFESAAGTRVDTQATKENALAPLMLVRRGMSAIEYIVETARPGEVIHVREDEYYNPHLWRNYLDFDALG